MVEAPTYGTPGWRPLLRPICGIADGVAAGCNTLPVNQMSGAMRPTMSHCSDLVLVPYAVRAMRAADGFVACLPKDGEESAWA